MANIFGIEYETPEEAQGRWNSQFEQMKAQVAGDSLALANISQQQAVFNALGNRDTQSAARKQKLLGSVLQGVQKETGEDEIDYQARIATEVRNRAAKEFPDIALQANDQIINLQTQKQERRKLMADADTSEVERDEKIWGFENLKRPVIFGQRADGTNVPLKRLGANASEEEIKAALAEQAEITGEQFVGYDVGNGMDEFNLDELDISESGYGLNNSTIAERVKSLSAGKVLFHSIKDLAEELKDTPDILSPLAQGGFSVTEKLRNNIESLKTLVLGKTQVYGEEREKLAADYEARIDAKLNLDDRYDKSAGNAGVVRARVTALAYQLAKTLDPGGRLSDQDIEMAKTMILGNSTPQDITRLFNKRVAETHEQLQLQLDEAMAGRYGPEAKTEAGRYLQKRQETIQALVELGDQVKAMRERDNRDDKGTPGGPAKDPSEMTMAELAEAANL